MRTSFESGQAHSKQWPEVMHAAYRLLEQSSVQAQLQYWIQPLTWMQGHRAEDGTLDVHLGAPNAFWAQWIDEHFKKKLESALTQVSGSPARVQVIPLKDAEAKKDRFFKDTFQEIPADLDGASQPFSRSIEQNTDEESAVEQEDEKPTNTAGFAPSTLGYVRMDSAESHNVSRNNSIDSRYQFDNFVVGASNEFAYASCVAVSEAIGSQYNPLFIYSPPGLGKTHLLHAIGNQALKKNPSTRVFYVSTENFVNELIESIQRKKMAEFRKMYRYSYDILLIDDIQFLAGKGKTEEEFFHTFNALYGSKRQIVLTSDRPPSDIEGLEERVRTRFEWGLVADITPPEIETRIAILRAKAETDDIYLPEDVATFLATHVKNSVRNLEGLLVKLQAQASLTGTEISLEMAKKELKISIPEECSQLTVETIQQAVMKHFNLKLQDLKGHGRTKNLVTARQISMFLIRKYTDLGSQEIGQYFNGRDHSTVLHAIKKIESELGEESEVKTLVEQVQNLL